MNNVIDLRTRRIIAPPALETELTRSCWQPIIFHAKPDVTFDLTRPIRQRVEEILLDAVDRIMEEICDD